MKTITLWVTSRANENPGENGYQVHILDPDPGIENERRSLASGFGVPIPVTVSDKVELADTKDGFPSYWIGGVPLWFQWHPEKGLVTAWVAFESVPEFKNRWVFQSVKRSAVN